MCVGFKSWHVGRGTVLSCEVLMPTVDPMACLAWKEHSGSSIFLCLL